MCLAPTIKSMTDICITQEDQPIAVSQMISDLTYLCLPIIIQQAVSILSLDFVINIKLIGGKCVVDKHDYFDQLFNC